MRNINSLHPELIEKLYLLKDICQKNGLKIGIGECVRTAQEQDILYAQGRTKPGNIVTNCKGSTYSSMHQWGVAFDFYRNDGKGLYNDNDGFFVKVGKIGEDIGLMWGGSWKSPVDKPHFQLPNWGATATKLKKLYGTPDIFFKTWGDDTMTETEKKQFNLLVEQVEKLTLQAEKIYHKTTEIPEWAKPTMEKLIDKGLYNGAGENDLNLPETLMRVLVINDRAGLYD